MTAQNPSTKLTCTLTESTDWQTETSWQIPDRICHMIIKQSKPKPLPKLTDWLTSTGSLTALLEAKARQPLRVKRTFEGYRRLTLSQKKQLGMRGQVLNRPMVGWVREVLLYGNQQEPWIMAQSIFPLPSLQGNGKRLKNLKGTPIGYVLFKRQKTLPNTRIICHTSKGWQRQTLYDWHGRKLLIAETFLEEFL